MAIGGRVGVTAVATAAMATSALPLYGVSALGPSLVTDLRLSRPQHGTLVAVTIGAAALLSLPAGRLVDRAGARTGLVGIAALVAGALLAASLAGSYGWLLAALAVAGRIWWTRHSPGRPAAILAGLALVAAGCALPLVLATLPGLGALVWCGAFGVGAFATAAYAVAMLDVVRHAHEDTGRASGLVSIGFFLGFAAGPVGFGFLTSHAGYRAGWTAVAATLALAAAAGLPLRRPLPP